MTSPTHFRYLSVLRKLFHWNLAFGSLLTCLVVGDHPSDSWSSQTGAGWPVQWGLRNGKPVPVHYTLDPKIDLKLLQPAFRVLPILALKLDPADLLDPSRGIYSNPMEQGELWERPVQARWFPVSGTNGFTISCGIRIQGGWNRRPEESPKHSLRLIFRNQYGAKTLKFPLFEGQPSTFNTLILRGGNNNSWLHWSGEERHRADYLRDEWMRQTYAAMGHLSARGRFVHLSINDLYWGIYNLTERPDAHFAASHLGGKPKDWDARNGDKIVSGDATAWKQLFALAPRASEPEIWAKITPLLDVEAFVDYMILNLYGANGDWDGSSNWYSGRRRKPAGGQLFFIWDGERTLEGLSDTRLKEESEGSPSWLFQRLRLNSAFKDTFRLRAARHLNLGGALSPIVAGGRFKDLADQLAPAMIAEAARWGNYRATVDSYKTGPFEYYSVEEHWKPEISRLLRTYFPARTDIFSRQLGEAGLLP